MQLDAVRDLHAAPAQHLVIISHDGLDRTGAEGGCERRRDATLEQVAGDIAHLGLDDLERLPFALANLDREQLEEMTVVVGRRGSGSLGAIEQAVRDIESDRPRAWRR